MKKDFFSNEMKKKTYIKENKFFLDYILIILNNNKYKNKDKYKAILNL